MKGFEPSTFAMATPSPLADPRRHARNANLEYGFGMPDEVG
jgi:hypothetical protein